MSVLFNSLAQCVYYCQSAQHHNIKHTHTHTRTYRTISSTIPYSINTQTERWHLSPKDPLFFFAALTHAHSNTCPPCTCTHMHAHFRGRTATRFVLFKPVKHSVIIFLTVLQTEFISSLINHQISNTVQLN